MQSVSVRNVEQALPAHQPLPSGQLNLADNFYVVNQYDSQHEDMQAQLPRH